MWISEHVVPGAAFGDGQRGLFICSSMHVELDLSLAMYLYFSGRDPSLLCS